jgi:CDGSH-type Zn-finger protein
MADQVTVRARENGPFLIPATVKLVDHLGNPFPFPVGKENIALCRCGQSKNKPFCDGSHKTCAFLAAELAPAPVQPNAEPPAPGS